MFLMKEVYFENKFTVLFNIYLFLTFLIKYILSFYIEVIKNKKVKLS